ncbi:MAG: PilZ domain-containing protein [Phycisphaerae bacterium]
MLTTKHPPAPGATTVLDVPATTHDASPPCDRREHPRKAVSIPAELTVSRGLPPVDGLAECIGPGGMRVRVPASGDVALGSCLDLYLDQNAIPDDLKPLKGLVLSGTVIRTERAVADNVRVGLRFDQPIYF